MEVRQLKYFLSAVRMGSLKGAAERHFVTQPAISIQLKKLEQEVGQKLFARDGRRIVPTQAGVLLMTHAEDVLRSIDSLKNAMDGLKGCERGYLNLGTIDAASIYVLPPVLRAFQRRYPGVETRVRVADTDSLVAAVDSNEVEIAIVTLPVARVDLEIRPIYKDIMVLVASPKHRLTRSGLRGRNILKAVAESGLITYPAHSTTHRIIEGVFRDVGLSLRSTMEMSSPEAIKRLTETGLGASILPVKVVSGEVRRGTLKVISTGKVRFFRMLGMVHRRAERLSPPALAFLDIMDTKFTRCSSGKKL